MDALKNHYNWIIKYIFYAIIIAFLSEFFLTLDFDGMITAIKCQQVERIYYASDTVVYNAELKNNSIYTTNNDPQITIDEINDYIGNLQICLDDLSVSTLNLQVFYTQDGGFIEEKSVRGIFKENLNNITIEINQQVSGIRLDIGDLEGILYDLNAIIVNPKLGTFISNHCKNLSYIRILIYFIIILVFLLAIYDFARFKIFVFKYRWLIGMAMIVFGTILKLHGSSLGYISNILTGADTANLWGTKRDIRSDEFVVFTQMALSQVKSDFKWFSDIWGYSSSDMFMIYGQPIKNLVTIFRPFSVGYILLGAEYGLAFFWCSRWVFLFLSSFEFGRLITNDKRKLSLSYAFLIAFAPIVQWWFSINGFVEMLIFGQMAVILFLKYFRTESIKIKILVMLLLVVCAGGYILTLYPAWMIPMFYVFLACIIAVIIENHKVIKFKKNDFVIWGLGVIVLLIGMLYIFTTSKTTIEAIANTIYPGKRRYLGGPIENIIELFRGWTSYIWSFTDSVNPCEKVCFISFFPIGMILSVIILFKQKKNDVWLICLNIVNILLVIYTILELPPFIASITLLGNSSVRMIVAIGLINLMILIRALLHYEYNEKHLKIFLPLVLIIAAFSFYGVKEIVSPGLKLLIIMFIAVSITIILRYSLSVGKNQFLSLVVVITLIGGGIVNPVETGLSHIYNSAIVKSIDKINSEEDGLWFVNSSFVFANLPTITGAHTLNALATYPDIELWNKLGLQESENIWNRYSHMTANIGEKLYIEELRPDHIHLVVTINDLKELGVKYILSSSDLNTYTDLKLLVSNNGFYIYKIL